MAISVKSQNYHFGHVRENRAQISLGMAKITDEPTELPPIFIRERMKSQNVTGVELADRMDTTPATVSRLLNGHRKISLEWLYAFAKALGCPPSDLLTPPNGEKPKAIKSDAEILAVLAKIDGLSDTDIDLAYGVISNARALRRASQEPSVSDDPQQRANPLHVKAP